jgi:hypothetical protein
LATTEGKQTALTLNVCALVLWFSTSTSQVFESKTSLEPTDSTPCPVLDRRPPETT